MSSVSSSQNPMAHWRLSEAAHRVPVSGIVEVFNYGRTKPGLLPLWVGEGDMPTPAFIYEAATRALAAGETFYTYQGGLPQFREAVSSYMSTVYGRALPPERFFCTIGGMHALQIAVRLVSGAGDEVIVPTPAWPNFAGAITVNGGFVCDVPMQLVDNAYQLDFDQIEATIGPRTRAICVNSPSNPTGWTASDDDLRRLLALARKHDLWIIADEIYGRFYFKGERAPSFHDIMDDNDRIIFVQTMSKNWAMTGMRIGWIEVPPALGRTVESLIQYSTSGVAMPIQRAAIAALTQGESFVQHMVKRARTNHDLLMNSLLPRNDLVITRPSGAFYLFFAIKGVLSSREAAFSLVDNANIGLAPGSAFGTGGEGFMRMCYLRKSEDIEETVRRLLAGLDGLRNG